MDDDRDELPKLGKLAKTARDKHLKQARNTLLIVGILMMAVQTGFYFMESGQVKDELQRQINLAGGRVDPAKVQEAETTAQRFLMLFHGSAIMVGAIFVVLSFFVLKYPIPITLAALVLYIGLNVIFAVVNPANIVAGWLLKIIVVVCLFKALQAGIAAQREEQEAEAEEEFEAS